jgi:ubiquinone/menaquinone biosynthesis C-methylase UbiE
VGFYSRVIFPRLCDFALDRPSVAALRGDLLSQAAGEILEIGFGTGLNLPHYQRAVRRITVVEPNAGMHRRARRRAETTAIEVDVRPEGGERLPFGDAAFDCVVSTFTLCSIEQVERALGEICRVLKRDGRFLFLEHGLSPDPKVQKWQRRLNWLERMLAGNCRLDRPIRQLIEAQPFASVSLREFYLDKVPRTHGYLYQGAAVK